jgi:cell division protein FtsL
VIKHQTLHREHDPRVRRSLAVALALSALVVVGALGVVGLRVQRVHLAYQLDALRAERTRTETLIRQLEVEVATLRSPGRVEARARQLGMTAPARDQVRLAKEYVAGSTGGAAAADQGSRLASVPVPSRLAGGRPPLP